MARPTLEETLQRAVQRAQPFAPRQRQAQPFNLAEAAGVAFGTTAESLISQGTFGIYEPDFIPENIEQQYPVAASVGHVAGNIAGFLGTIYVTGGVLGGFGKGAGGLLGMTKWGKAILGASRMRGATSAATKVVKGSASGLLTGTNFAVQDIAREFVTQMKEQDFDAYEVGRKAVGGFMTGGIYGAAHGLFMFANPATNILAGGSIMATAEAVNMAAEGEDITKESLAVNFSIGAAMASFSAFKRGARAKGATDISEKEFMGTLKEMNNPGTPVGDRIKRIINGIGTLNPDAKDAILQIPTVANFYKLGKQIRVSRVGFIAGGKGGKTGIPRVVSTAKRNLESLMITTDMGKTIKVSTVSKKTGRAFPKKTFQSNKLGKQYIKERTGGRTDNINKMTDDELKLAATEITRYVEKSIMGDMNVFDMSYTQPGEALGTINIEKFIKKTGMGDLIEDVVAMKRFTDELNRGADTLIRAAAREWNLEAKVPLKQKIKAFAKAETKPAFVDMWWAKENLSKPGVKESLTPRQLQIAKKLKKFTDYFFTRHNEALEAQGLPKINKVEDYNTHVVRELQNGGKLSFEQLPSKRGISTPQPFTEKTRVGGGVPIRDPIVSFKAMVNQDLKRIYLMEPVRILKARMETTFGALDMSRTQINQATETMAHFANTFIWNQQTPPQQKLNKRVTEALSKGKIGDATFWLLKTLTGQDVGGRPADAMASVWGRALTNSLMGLRPDLAFRNAFQVLYNQSLYGTKALAKAMISPMTPRQKAVASSIGAFRASKQGGIVEETGDALGFFKDVHFKWNVKTSFKASWEHFFDKIGKGKWGTKEGKALRKKYGRNDILASNEERALVKNLEVSIQDTQFVYDKIGNPMGRTNPIYRAATTLQSFPMNYWHNYLGRHVKQFSLKKGGTTQAAWAPKEFDAPLTRSEQLGLFKHFVGMGVIVGTLARINGYDYSSTVGVGVSPRWIDQKKGIPVTLGVFNVRPNPAVQVFADFVGLLSGNDYERATAWRNLKSKAIIPTGLVAPGGLLALKAKRAIETGERETLLFRKVRGRRRKRRKPTPFVPFQPFPAPRRPTPQPFER